MRYLISSVPGSAWDRTAREAPPRIEARRHPAGITYTWGATRSEAEPRGQCGPRQSLGPRVGFTLLEMVLALSIGLVLMISLYSVLSLQVQQAQAGRRILDEGTIARSILTTMTNDILSNLGAANPTPTAASTSSSASSTTTTAPVATSDATIVFNNGVYGTNNLLILTVTKVPPPGTDPTLPATVADLRRISYWMVTDGPNTGLARQELLQATSNDLSLIPPDVTPDTVIPEVKDVTFQYFDGVNWQDTWDGTTLGGPTLEVPIGPPSAIAITLTFYARASDNSDLPDSPNPKYKHVVAIPGGNNFPQTNP